MPLRLISPGKLVYEWQRAQYGWLLLRTLPAQVLLIYLEWDGYQTGHGHHAIHQRILTTSLMDTK